MVKSDFYFYAHEESLLHPLFRFKYMKTFLEWVKTVVYVGVFYLTFTTVFVEGYQIPSGSMEPTLHGDKKWFKGDRIFALKGIFRFWPLKRGDIVIFVSVEDRKTFVVKRLVGLPGETVQIKYPYVYINGEPVTKAPFDKREYIEDRQHPLGYPVGPQTAPIPFRSCWATEEPLVIPKDCYFVLGDNSRNSKDSRIWGWLTKRDILGKAILIWFPISRGKLLE